MGILHNTVMLRDGLITRGLITGGMEGEEGRECKHNVCFFFLIFFIGKILRMIVR